MELSSDLISKFVKSTNDSGTKQNEIIVHGVIVSDGANKYVQFDGSSELAPLASTVEVNPGDRVIITVKNHSATVTGNITDPSIGTKTADGLRSSITQTAEEIRLEVANEVAGLKSSITQNADSITSIVEGQGEFSKFQQTVEGFLFKDESGNYVGIKDGSIEMTGAIKFTDLGDSDEVQASIDSAGSRASNALTQARAANSTAADAADTAAEAITTISGFTITEDSGTYIDGNMIYSDSIYADKMHLGGELTVYRSMYDNTVGGYLGYCSGFNSLTGIGVMNTVNTGQCICTNEAARLSYGGSSSVVANSDKVTIDSKRIFLAIDDSEMVTMDDTCIRPYGPGVSSMYLGKSDAPWAAVYADTGEVSTSDRNKKNSIEDLPEKYITMLDRMQPKRFKMNNGTSDRYHVGYIAQDVEAAMQAVGIDSQEFGGLVKDKDENGNDIYLLRYGEFDAIRDAKIKQLEAKNLELEARIEAIEKLLTQ